MKLTAEHERLEADRSRTANWKRWGPYLSERQWSTVREDYSANGTCWEYFPHDHARSRAYRWGEDGLLGITDRECRLCFALALWNGKDPILKERLFGVTGHEGNHGEDVKEEYFYLDSTPTHSYMRALYKYPHAEFPYQRLIDENRRRSRAEPEFELIDTGVFDGDRYFDVFAEYAKNSPNDLLIQITAVNRGPDPATLHLLPTLWFRNTWSWGAIDEAPKTKPLIRTGSNPGTLIAAHETLGNFQFVAPSDPAGNVPRLLFTENETNTRRLWNSGDADAFAKDAFHEFVVHGKSGRVNPRGEGTKSAIYYTLNLKAGEARTLKFRLFPAEKPPSEPLGPGFDRLFEIRRREATEFFATVIPGQATPAERNVARQGYAGLLWSKQFYHYIVSDWLAGDPNQPPPPLARLEGRNAEWSHLYSRDVISMPDKWEYPWFAAWDLAFHMIPFAEVDPQFAKDQLILFLREWYMHPNGQIPAYEFAFGDVNPPVHAWAAWRVYKIAGRRQGRDRVFLESVFQKLLLNFTWWVNRKDAHGRNLFSGGFLGLDNIGVFDRSKPLPMGGTLQQADGTAWMAFYCSTMLAMALELSFDGGTVHAAYEDMASKFLEHFVQIAGAMNTLGGSGLWNEEDGFYYDQIRFEHNSEPLRTRSMVGLLPLIAVEILDENQIRNLPGFSKRLDWFVKHRPDLSRHIARCDDTEGRRLLAIVSAGRLKRVLPYLLDENEFLSPFGLRSVSKFHEKNPYVFEAGGERHTVGYAPGDSATGLFGGNSNWRGPVWFPVNYLLIEALERYHHFFRENLKVEFPTGSGKEMTLREIARELSARLARIFLPDENGRRPFTGNDRRWTEDPHWRELVLFHEYFHAETGRGLGASHQTGWTALAVRAVAELSKSRKERPGQFGELNIQRSPNR
jgi:hypothetical protein